VSEQQRGDAMSERILTLQNEGTANAPRYAIMNHEGHYLNEKDGTWGRKSDCTLYGTPNAGATKIQDLLLERFSRVPTRKFVAPLVVKLYTDQPVTKTQVEDWLHQVVRIATDSCRHGLGPVVDSLGLITVDWSQLKEIQE
jgi:hypothetical protein